MCAVFFQFFSPPAPTSAHQQSAPGGVDAAQGGHGHSMRLPGWPRHTVWLLPGGPKLQEFPSLVWFSSSAQYGLLARATVLGFATHYCWNKMQFIAIARVVALQFNECSLVE